MTKNVKKIEEKPIKVILLGESGVGKTSIILRYSKDKFETIAASTIGATFIEKDLIRNNIKYTLNIWDTTGQEKYHSVTKLFIQGADIVILVYSIDKNITFKALDYWYQTVIDMCGDNIILAIIGNKYDLFDKEEIQDEKVEDEVGENYAKEKNAIFKLVTAKLDRKGIDSLFDELLNEYIKKNGGENIGKKDNNNNNNNKLEIKKEKKNEKKRSFC